MATADVCKDIPDLDDLRYYVKHKNLAEGRFPPQFGKGLSRDALKSAKANLRKMEKVWVFNEKEDRFYRRIEPLAGELPGDVLVPVAESEREARLLLQEHHYYQDSAHGMHEGGLHMFIRARRRFYIFNLRTWCDAISKHCISCLQHRSGAKGEVTPIMPITASKPNERVYCVVACIY